MRLVVFSSKPCWAAEGLSGFATDGGFPRQMAALAELFDATRLVLPHRATPTPTGLTPLDGPGMTVRTIAEPAGRGTVRKLSVALRLPILLGILWRECGRVDAVHVPVPGDIGGLGLLVALARGKPLFVRHCGTWGARRTLAELLLWHLLIRIAGGRRVVLATGGGSAPPEPRQPAITWIFSTTLRDAELAELPKAEPWRPGQPLRLLSVGRLVPGKNVAATIGALAHLRPEHPGATLDVVGHGPELGALRALAEELRVAGAVVFHGNLSRSQVLERYGAAHLLVFPTRVAEGFPKVVPEAMACGCPVIATPVSVLPELLGDGRGALLAGSSPEDTSAHAVATAIRDLLADPRSLPALAESARRHAAALTLERWRDAIGRRLEHAWGRSLRNGRHRSAEAWP